MECDWLWMGQYCDNNSGIAQFYDTISHLAKTLPEGVPFLEVGTRKGGTALITLEAIRCSGKGRWFFTVDPYGGKPYKWDEDRIWENQPYGEQFYQTAMYEISKFSMEHKLLHSHWRMTSFDFLKTYNQFDFWYAGMIQKKQFGFVYLDGEHFVDTVVQELQGFIPYMVPGGMIVIDDVCSDFNKNDYMKKILEKSKVENGKAYFTVE